MAADQPQTRRDHDLLLGLITGFEAELIHHILYGDL